VYNQIMKKVNLSTKQLSKFAGMWVAVDTTREKIVAAAKSFKEIAPLVTKPVGSKTPDERIPAAFKVPRKNERYYIL